MGWGITTLDKPEGDLGIKNLKLARFSLFAKHILSLLNCKEIAWVEILKMKYGSICNWHFNHPANCS